MSFESVKFPLLTNVTATLRRWAPALRALDARARFDDFSSWIDYDPVIHMAPVGIYQDVEMGYAKYCVVGDGRVVFIKILFSIDVTTAGNGQIFVSLPLETTHVGRQLLQADNTTIEGWLAGGDIVAGVGEDGIFWDGTSATTLGRGGEWLQIYGVSVGATSYLVDGCYLTS